MRPSEDELIARYFAPLAGPGGLGLADDAALATPRSGYDLVVTKDMLVAGVHFFPDDPPGAIARKALRVNLSDLAAKAALPLGFLLGLGLPENWSEHWLAAFAEGLGDDARQFCCPLLGGDTVKTSGPLTLSISAFGEIASGQMVRRNATKPGDAIYVSGTIGDAALGLRVRRADRAADPWLDLLHRSAADILRDRYLLPRPRLGLRTALLAHARAAMDVSDGLVGDLAKMLRLADVSVSVRVADVPLSRAARAAIILAPPLVETALAGGDDYEILCAIAPEEAASFEAEARRFEVPVTRIGVTVPGYKDPVFLDENSVEMRFTAGSFSHF